MAKLWSKKKTIGHPWVETQVKSTIGQIIVTRKSCCKMYINKAVYCKNQFQISPLFSDLSGCKLIQVPDALYFMIEERNIEVLACNLSSNVIKKIPPKLPSKFSLITDLNLSFNKLSALPEEVSKWSQLETADISNNKFDSLPACLLSLPKIIQINAANNSITG